MRKTSQKFLQSNLLCRVALVAILLAFGYRDFRIGQ